LISRRTLLLAGVCALSIAIPIAYSKGRSFEGRRLQAEGYVGEDDVLNTFPIVFVRTLVGGEPESLRIVASTGLLLTGVCLISIFFDFAPKRPKVGGTLIVPIDNTVIAATTTGIASTGINLKDAGSPGDEPHG
jgi:hypothetical protein